jgi:O-antigen/teichoic acid export membrane protein
MYGKAILQGQGRYMAFNLLRNAVVVFYLAGLGIVLASGRSGLIEFTAAWVAANVLSGALALLVALRGNRPPSTTRSTSRGDLFRFGLKGYLASLSPVTTFRLDQALIGLFLAPRALGLYVAALAFTHLPEIIARGVGMIALPHVASLGGSGRRRDIRMFFVVTTALTGAVTVVLEIGAGWLVPLFFGADFEGSITIARILLVGSFLWGVRRIITDTASGSGRPILGSLAELVSWIVICPALVLFLPLWGVTGVAAAMTLSSAVSLIVLVALVIRADRRGGAREHGRRRRTPRTSLWTL